MRGIKFADILTRKPELYFRAGPTVLSFYSLHKSVPVEMYAEQFVQLLRQVNLGLGNVMIVGTVVRVVGVTFRDCDDDGVGGVLVLLTAFQIVVHGHFLYKKKYPLLMRLSVAGYAAPLGSSPQGMTWSLQVPRVYIGPSRLRSYRNSKSVTGHISRRAAETLVPYTVGLRPSHAALMGARTGILLSSTALFPVTQGDIPARIPNVAKNVTVGNRLPFGLPFATFVA